MPSEDNEIFLLHSIAARSLKKVPIHTTHKISIFVRIQMDKATVNKEPKKLKIVHLSSAHNDRDVRIFLKECRSLARNYPTAEIHLVLAGVPERLEDGVHVHSVFGGLLADDRHRHLAQFSEGQRGGAPHGL